MKKTLLLLPLFSLALYVGAAVPSKCTDKASCSGSTEAASKKTHKSPGLLQARRQAAAVTYHYSDVPLRPAPGMTAWRPEPKKLEVAEKTSARPVISRIQRIDRTERVEPAEHVDQVEQVERPKVSETAFVSARLDGSLAVQESQAKAN